MNAPATASSLVDLRSIRRDGGTQIRAALSEDHVCELVEAINAGVSLPPVVAFGDRTDATGALWLADGFHRAEAWSRAGVDRVPVERRNGTRRDAVLYACGANTAHGLKRTNLDKRRAVEAMLRDEEWSRWSDREIARRAGVAHTLVADLRSSGVGLQMDGPRTVERNGKTYEMNTGSIGRAPPSPPSAPFAPPIADDSLTFDDPADDLDAVSLVTPPTAPAAVPDPPPFSADEATRFYCRAAETCFATMTARWRLVPESYRGEILARLPPGVAAYHEVNDDMTDESFAWATCGHAPAFQRGLCHGCYRKLTDAGLATGEDGRVYENSDRGLRQLAHRLSSATPATVGDIVQRLKPDARERLAEALARVSGKGRG